MLEGCSLVERRLLELSLIFRCPHCRRGNVTVDEIGAAGWFCPRCEERTNCVDGIPNGLSAEREDYFKTFCRDYLTILNAEEDRSIANIEDTRRPKESALQVRSVRFFERSILRRLAAEVSRPLRILDAGAGSGWLAHRLLSAGHQPLALDLLTDPRHGLRACRQYGDGSGAMFPAVRGEFEELPLADDQFDLVIFNQAFHFALDYWRTLQEARRCLRWGGRVVIIDTPIFSRWRDGEALVEQRRSELEQAHGCCLDSVPSMGYLSLEMIEDLANDLNMEWKFHRPGSGLGKYIDAVTSRLKGGGQRPMRCILEGSWPTAVS